MRDPRRVAVLISGRGSNMKALAGNARGYEVALVASNRPEAEGLDWARAEKLPTWTWDSRGRGKAEFEAALDQVLEDHRIGTIALAGFMQILTADFTHRWAGRVLNIHPSLLPKYRGLDTHQRALDAGDSVAGCTVHLVTEELDAGDVLAQAEVPVLPGDDAITLQDRVLAAEHRLYPETLASFVSRA
jgi:phosphoribosylglycinamide formyltransferase-1